MLIWMGDGSGELPPRFFGVELPPSFVPSRSLRHTNRLRPSSRLRPSPRPSPRTRGEGENLKI